MNSNIISISRSKWSQNFCRSIEIYCKFFRKVWSRTINPFTLKLRRSICIIESSQPHSTNISSQCPFTKPNIVFEILCILSFSFIIIAKLLSSIHTLIPSLYLKMILLSNNDDPLQHFHGRHLQINHSKFKNYSWKHCGKRILH